MSNTVAKGSMQNEQRLDGRVHAYVLVSAKWPHNCTLEEPIVKMFLPTQPTPSLRMESSIIKYADDVKY